MEGLIYQPFVHIDNLTEYVRQGRYGLIGPEKEIITPNDCESMIESDMHITMTLWPIPEPLKEEEPPVAADFDLDAILNLDDFLNPPGGSNKNGEVYLLFYHVLVADIIILKAKR